VFVKDVIKIKVLEELSEKVQSCYVRRAEGEGGSITMSGEQSEKVLPQIDLDMSGGDGS